MCFKLSSSPITLAMPPNPPKVFAIHPTNAQAKEAKILALVPMVLVFVVSVSFFGISFSISFKNFILKLPRAVEEAPMRITHISHHMNTHHLAL